MFTGQMPNITQAQIAAVLTFVVGQAVAWGLLDGRSSQQLVSAGSTLVAVAWKLADAYLRGSRAKAKAIEHAASVGNTPTVTT